MDEEKQEKSQCELPCCSCDGKAEVFEMDEIPFLSLHDNWIPLYRGRDDMDSILEAFKKYCEIEKCEE